MGVLCGAWQVLQDLSDKQHPYIVSLHHSFQDDSHLYLVMDFVGGGLHACAIMGIIGVRAPTVPRLRAAHGTGASKPSAPPPLPPHTCSCPRYGQWHNTPARKGLNIRAACAGDLFMLIESQERLPEEWVRSPC